jgi:hypothetical protein
MAKNIPTTIEDITCEWLTDVLNRNVSGFSVEDSNSGTTGRAVLAMQYGDDCQAPHRIFVKLAPVDEMQQAFVASSDMGRREAMFYQSLSSEVPVRVPACYHSAWGESETQYIMLLEHLDDSGCTFRNSSQRYSMDYVRSVMAAFARLHAAYWETPRLQEDLQWIKAPLQHPIALQLIDSAMQQHAGEMPPEFSAMAELYLNNADAIHQLWNRGSSTIIHGDVHDANLFLEGDNPGFLDWALVARGPGMRDVGYFLAGTLSPSDQQLHAEDMLVFYRQQLLSQGVTSPPSHEELRLQYAWHSTYVWVGAAVTLAMGDAWQPQDYVRSTLERLHLTMAHLGAIDAVREHL